ncbi:MAG: gluconate 2-dehydrogenase subunit 3 family protein [Acidobacteriia bacterium]|nr:gluconate 2-dehydrogenase subunit 3 family protein [Terriglobia bacterium]
MADQEQLTRRELIQISAAAAAVAVGAQHGAEGESVEKFFSQDEFAMLDELTDLIIPTDDHSPGARAAGVAAYLDRRLAESIEDERKQQWHAGLKRVDALAREMQGVPFMKATPEQRVAVLARISRNEQSPQTPEERFFVELKFSTADAYYSSKIGIHQEMEYKGNVLLPEFVGYEVR